MKETDMYKDDIDREKFYFFMFLTQLNYKNEKFIEVIIKDRDSHIPTKEEFNKNKILHEYNNDSYEDFIRIYNSEIKIAIKLECNKIQNVDREINEYLDKDFKLYNICGKIEKNSIMYDVCNLVITNEKYISEIIEKNTKGEEKAKVNKYKSHEKFVKYYHKNKDKEYIPITYIMYCVEAYEKFLKYDSKLDTAKAVTVQWTSKVKFIKENIEDILPNYSEYIFGEQDKVKYDVLIDKLSLLHEDIKKLVIDKNFNYRKGLNTFIKGVPGTGKSRKVKQLTSDIKKENILRINIHSDMSSSDIIQGISVNIDEDNQIIYKEKYGLVLKYILKAILNPNDRFAIVLEEVQEKALNKLIGSLIYLIEEDKRVSCKYIKQLIDKKKIKIENSNIDEVFNTINDIINTHEDIEYIDIPNLIEGCNESRKLILPDNVYFFLTTNYRKDKVVIEDNMLRRFSIIEMYPEYKYTATYENNIVSDFLENLNINIIKVFSDEMHPERMIIGHASWLNIKTCQEFYDNFIKLIVEFNDIRLIEYFQFKAIFSKELWVDFFSYEKEDSEIFNCIVNLINNIYDEETNSYFELMLSIQDELRKEAQK